MEQDEEHLGLLTVFHYVVGGLAALFSCIALMYVGFGCLMLYAPTQGQGEPPPAVMGWIFIAFGGVLFLIGEVMALASFSPVATSASKSITGSRS